MLGNIGHDLCGLLQCPTYYSRFSQSVRKARLSCFKSSLRGCYDAVSLQIEDCCCNKIPNKILLELRSLSLCPSAHAIFRLFKVVMSRFRLNFFIVVHFLH